jgi:hypothetical protein
MFGELSSIPWIKGGNEKHWTTVIHEGHSLYWEWKPAEANLGPEEFLIFCKTAFPNGGCLVQGHSNHSLIWCAMEGDLYGVGIRKMKFSGEWVVSVLETTEEYPGASGCPDKSLCLKACRFIAVEFLRGTNPIDLYNCEEYIFQEDASWWEYLVKLEKVVNWKYPEAQKYRLRSTLSNGSRGRESDNKNASRRQRSQHVSKRSWESKSDRGNQRNSYPANTEANRRSGVNDFPRSRSPSVDVPAKSNLTSLPVSVQSTSESRGLKCSRCEISFKHSYELMRHLNSEEHRQALSREFPI